MDGGELGISALGAISIGLVTLMMAVTPARAKNEKPFAAEECRELCSPIEVRRYLPGFCHIDRDQHNVIRCDSQTSTEYVVPVFDVCSCGSQLAP